ncbi:hypothetical protein C8J56DRAFT_936340, partial [Mycena floridula]
MWSTIRLNERDFDIIKLDDSGRRRTLLMLGVQLCRSGSHQLSVSISTILATAPSHPLLQLLFPTSYRWKDLLLSVPVSFLPSLDPLRGCLSSLQRLHVWSPDFDEKSPLQHQILAFEFAPKLTSLIGNPYIFLKLLIPYAQITAYESKIRWTCCVYASLLSFIVTCCIDEALDVRHGMTATPNLVNLPHLYLANLDSTANCFLLRRLSLPSLKKLEISVDRSVAGLKAMLQRSRCSLEKVELALNDVPDDTSISEVLDVTPTLISLKIDCIEAVATKLFNDLIQGSSLLPSLQFLKLMDSLSYPLFQLSLSDIIQLKALRPGL